MAIDPSIPLQGKMFSLADVLNDAQQRQARTQAMQIQQQQANIQQQEFARQQQQQSLADLALANQRSAVRQASTGDYAGADKAFGYGAGDIDIHGKIAGMQDEHRKQARAQFAAAVPIAIQALGNPDPNARKALIQSASPQLVAAGWKPEEIAAFQPTDENLKGLIENSRTAEDALAKYDAANKPQEPFTLGQDQQRYDGKGHLIASGPESIKAITTPEGGTTTIYGGAGHTGMGGGDRYVNGWSPRARNGGDNSDASVDNYISHVSQKLGIDPNAPIPQSAIPQLASAMAEFESGGKPTAISVRNNNPGNIKGSGPGGFKHFDTPQAGAAAQQALLTRYFARGQNTVKSIIEGVPAHGGGSGGPITIQGQPKQAESKIPQGYRPTADGNLEPIPGGPADPGTAEMPPPRELAKRNAAYPKVSGAYRGSVAKINQQINDIGTLAKMPGLDSIVGVFDANTPNITPASRAAKALYDKIMARGQFNELQDMRNSSPTGGALGAVSDGENKTLRQAAAALDRTQSETDFRARLDDYLQALKASKDSITQTFDDTYAYRGRSTAPSSAAKPTVSNW